VSINSAIRLNKFISDSGHCSRREADKLIESNRVKINGKLPQLGAKVEADDEVTVDGMAIYSSATNKSDRVYLAYNKPIGITCTTEQNVKGNIVDAVDHDERIFPIGRLDKPSEGLILLTNDGDIVNKILRAENAHDKEYLVTVNKNIGQGFVDKMSAGVPILGTVTKPCKVNQQGKSTFKITLTQGLNRQIRRMCEYLGYEVLSLKRLRIMNIELGKLRSGQWRKLTRPEMDILKSAIADSSSETSRKPKRSISRTKSSPHSKAAPGRRPGTRKNTSTGNKQTKGTNQKKKSTSTTTKNNKPKAKLTNKTSPKHSAPKKKGKKTTNKNAVKARKPKRK
jgi:pseudouridine synthase